MHAVAAQSSGQRRLLTARGATHASTLLPIEQGVRGSIARCTGVGSSSDRHHAQSVTTDEGGSREFAIQARLVEWRGNVVVRNETRLEFAATLTDAMRSARVHTADGFTVWVFEIRRDGIRPRYVRVDTLAPEAARTR